MPEPLRDPVTAPPAPAVAGAGAVVVGGGPAGLMAAEVLAAGGVAVDLFDAMPSVGRKFLLAGRGGLNLTHSEAFEPFVGRYETAAPTLRPWLEAFGPAQVRAWAAGLGIETFVGTSGRVFPRDMKAAPLLRAWLHRLRAAGVRVHARHRWQGWTADGALRLAGAQGEVLLRPAATVLTLGGGSWPQLGSDGAWQALLAERGVALAPPRPANCGFDVIAATGATTGATTGAAAGAGTGPAGWSEYLAERYAGQPVKPVAATFVGPDGEPRRQQGEFVLTASGVEGSLIYAFSALLREAIAREGRATLLLDLLPAHTAAQVQAEVARPRGPRSLATHLKSRLGIQGLKLALLHEVMGAERLKDPAQLAAALKALPLVLGAPRPLAEAISTAGGVRFEALDARLMLRALPGVFCAGEMLDWEAPTGGYLLTACLATGRAAGAGALAWLQRPEASIARPSASATSMPSTPADMMPPA